MSASTTSVRCPAWASVMARLLEMSVLPSCGPVLVMTSVRAPFVGRREQQRRPHRADRLGKRRRDVVMEHRRFAVVLLGGHRRHHAEERHVEVRANFLGRLDAGCRSTRRRRPARCASRHPPNAATSRSRLVCGSTGDARHLGLVEHLNARAAIAARRVALFRPLHQGVVQLLVARGFTLERRIVHHLPVEPDRGRALFVETLLKGRRLLLSHFVLRLDGRHDLADFALQIRTRRIYLRLRLLQRLDSAGRKWTAILLTTSCLACTSAFSFWTVSALHDRGERIERLPLLLRAR